VLSSATFIVKRPYAFVKDEWVGKGQTILATVRRDGTVRLSGKLFTSPSLAGSAACKAPTCNGWRFWQYERAPGDWVKLDELRNK